jgi:acetone carboxylase gamma subunit
MAEFHKEDIARLMDGELPWPAVQDMLKSPKDLDRFDKYLEIMAERVPWDDTILLPLTPQLMIVARKGERVVKCVCGQEYGDYRVNWKLAALVHVRDSQQALDEIYRGRDALDEAWVQLREYICPGCGSMLEVEAVPRGCPPDFEFLPDLDTFYREWLGRELPDKCEYEDRTLAVVAEWSSEGE